MIENAGEELGSNDRIRYAHRILEEGSSADRQLATFEKTSDLKTVVDQLINETIEGINYKRKNSPLRYLYSKIIFIHRSLC